MSTATDSPRFDVTVAHADEVYRIPSSYVSTVITDEDRAWAESMIEGGHRTKYLDLTPEQCEIINEFSAERIIHVMARFTFAYAVYRVGLVVCPKQHAETFDEETGELLTDENGEPVGPIIIPDHDFGLTVVREGLTDCLGQSIPKGYCYFRVIHQSGNRPRNKTNYESLVLRIAKWMLNGEQLIKDCTGCGVTEQHRCIARAIASLVGVKYPGSKEAEIIDPNWGPLVLATDGVHPLAAITADTGKANTGKDQFASNPELLPVDMLQTKESLTGHTPEPVYMTNRVEERTKALGKCESAMKRILLRGGRKNVNASFPGGANLATETALRAMETFPDMDTVAAYCHILSCPRFEKVGPSGKPTTVQPVSPNDLATAIALYSLRNEEPIDTLGTGDGRPMDEVSPIRIDVEEFLPLLEDIVNSGGSEVTPVKEWLAARASGRYSQNPADKFAQLLRMVVAYFNPDEEVTTDLLAKPAYAAKQGKSSGFYTVGGFDRGPKAKKAKGDDSEA